MTLDEDLQKIIRFITVRDLNRAYNKEKLTPEESLNLNRNFGSVITNGEDPNLFLNEKPEVVQNEVGKKLKDYSKDAERAIKGNEKEIMDLYVTNLGDFIEQIEDKLEDNEDFKDLPEDVKEHIKRLNILTYLGGFFKNLKIAEKYLDEEGDDYDEDLKKLSNTLKEFSMLENAVDSESREESTKYATIKRYGLTDNVRNFRKDWSGDQYTLMRDIYRKVIASEFLKDDYKIDEKKIRKLFEDNTNNYVEMAKYISQVKSIKDEVRTETDEEDIRDLALAA